MNLGAQSLFVISKNDRGDQGDQINAPLLQILCNTGTQPGGSISCGRRTRVFQGFRGEELRGGGSNAPSFVARKSFGRSLNCSAKINHSPGVANPSRRIVEAPSGLGASSG